MAAKIEAASVSRGWINQTAWRCCAPHSLIRGLLPLCTTSSCSLESLKFRSLQAPDDQLVLNLFAPQQKYDIVPWCVATDEKCDNGTGFRGFPRFFWARKSHPLTYMMPGSPATPASHINYLANV